MDEANEQQRQAQLARRLGEMGLAVHAHPGQRSVRFTLALRDPLLLGLKGAIRVDEATLATAGGTRVKCLRPHALFQLPLFSIGDCGNAEDIEDRLRRTWNEHIRELERAHAQLVARGLAPIPEAEGAALAFSLGLDDRAAHARFIDERRVVLPGRGPLHGRPLADALERVHHLDRETDTAAESQIALTTRLEALARKTPIYRAPSELAGPELITSPSALRASFGPSVLLVGPALCRDRALASALQSLGFRAQREVTAQDALAAFREQTFELVLADVHLGRLEGIDLVPEFAKLPGLARMPVVLVDEHPRESIRTAARHIGAAGYLAHPVDVDRVGQALFRMARGSRGRRFERLSQQLPVDGGRIEGVTRSVSRGGMFLGTRHTPPGDIALGFEISVPELPRPIRVDAETVYRMETSGAGPSGLGLRFRAFPDRDEALWIAYLTALFGGRARR